MFKSIYQIRDWLTDALNEHDPEGFRITITAPSMEHAERIYYEMMKELAEQLRTKTDPIPTRNLKICGIEVKLNVKQEELI